jgi:hypothetical protein
MVLGVTDGDVLADGVVEGDVAGDADGADEETAGEVVVSACATGD